MLSEEPGLIRNGRIRIIEYDNNRVEFRPIRYKVKREFQHGIRGITNHKKPLLYLHHKHRKQVIAVSSPPGGDGNEESPDNAEHHTI